MDETEERVREMICASEIPAKMAAALRDSLRYSTRMHTALASDDELALGATKIGGQPDLPPAMSWPEWRGAPLNVVAQIQLADIAAYDSDGELPHDGALSFFFDRTNWGKPGRDAEGSLATVLYRPVGAVVQRLPWTDALDARERYAPLAVASSTRELSLPDFEGPFIERAGYAWESISGRNAIPEARATAVRILALLSRITEYVRGASGLKGSVHRVLGHADELPFAIEYDWQGLAQTILCPDLCIQRSARFSKLIGGCWRRWIQI
jgi:hypothetical protein